VRLSPTILLKVDTENASGWIRLMDQKQVRLAREAGGCTKAVILQMLYGAGSIGA